MDEPFSSSFDNFTEVITLILTVTFSTRSRSAVWPSVSAEIVATVGLIVCTFAICANSVILAVLVRARKQFGSSIHTLIANQCAMDLFTCIFIIPRHITKLAHGFNYNRNEILDGAICIFIEKYAKPFMRIFSRFNITQFLFYRTIK